MYSHRVVCQRCPWIPLDYKIRTCGRAERSRLTLRKILPRPRTEASRGAVLQKYTIALIPRVLFPARFSGIVAINKHIAARVENHRGTRGRWIETVGKHSRVNWFLEYPGIHRPGQGLMKTRRPAGRIEQRAQMFFIKLYVQDDHAEVILIRKYI